MYQVEHLELDTDGQLQTEEYNMKSNINESPLRTYSVIPSKWQTYKGEMYNTLQPERHYQDGFRDIVIPTYNTETHKLGPLIVSGDIVTYEVITLTPEEIAQRNQNRLDSDTSATKLEHAISDGQIMYQRFFAYLQRQFDSGNITATQAKNSAMLLWNPLLPINYGQFLVAQLNLNALNPPTNSKELAILNLAKQQVNDYLT